MRVNLNDNFKRLFNNNIANKKDKSNTIKQDLEKIISRHAKPSFDRCEFDSRLLECSEKNQKSLDDFEKLDVDLLAFLYNDAKVGCRFARQRQQTLMAFSDQLKAYDKEIATLQNMIDKKETMKYKMTEEDALKAIDTLKVARQYFLENGAKKLGSYSSSTVFDEHTWSYNKGFNGAVPRITADDLNVDFNSHDIYAELDRAIESEKTIADAYAIGAAEISNILKRVAPQSNPTLQQIGVYENQYEKFFIKEYNQYDAGTFVDINKEIVKRIYKIYGEK